mmetsp:Transcript_28417/g.29593  ORF Transcript_28417/g.29593 Transcript_28417/m.29593 type:complete len:91 (-) Transcript_28417:4-276(-)
MEKPSFPLNIVKEKMILSLPPNTQIDNSAVIAVSHALKEFLKELSSEIHDEVKPNEKKVMIKEIKEAIENNPKYSFLNILIDNQAKETGK